MALTSTSIFLLLKVTNPKMRSTLSFLVKTRPSYKLITTLQVMIVNDKTGSFCGSFLKET